MALSRRYPGLEKLFVDVLKVKDAGAADFVAELTSLSGLIDRIGDIKKLLAALSLYAYGPQDTIKRLASDGLLVFPIKEANGEICLRSATDSSWFIPDRKLLGEVFSEHLPMLDLSETELTAIGPLIGMMGLQDRMLSKHVVEETCAVGECTFEVRLTDSLRSKAPYIAQ